MNLISKTHHLYENREYAFMILQKYTIISRTSLEPTTSLEIDLIFCKGLDPIT